MAETPSSNLAYDNFFEATLTGDITASSTDILMDNIPTASEGFLVIEPDSDSAREIIFYTSKTALKVVCPSAANGRGLGGTTAGAHSTGATVIMAPIAELYEALQNATNWSTSVRGGWLPVSNEGTVSYASATTITVPSTVASMCTVGTKIKFDNPSTKYFYVTGVSGTTLTVNGGTDYTVANSAITNIYISQDASPKDFPQAFAYTPTWANFTVGNGTLNFARYKQIGKTVHFELKFTLGSTSAMGSNATVSLPVPQSTHYTQYSAINSFGILNDITGFIYNVNLVYTTGQTALLFFWNAANPHSLAATTSSTSPFTWATGDYIAISGTYEAA